MNDSLHPSIVLALHESSDAIREYEQRAKHVSERRFDKELESYLTQPELYRFGGVVNAILSISTQCEKQASQCPEYSEAEADYLYASQVLDACARMVDLVFSERSSQRQRKRQMEEGLLLLGEIRP